jgi:hypothetical protein
MSEQEKKRADNYYLSPSDLEKHNRFEANKKKTVATIQVISATAGQRVIQDGKTGTIRIRPGDPQKKDEEIVLEPADLRRLGRGDSSKQLESMRRTLEKGQVQEERETGPSEDLYLGDRTMSGVGAYIALTEFAADVLGEAYGFAMDPHTQIGFYIQAEKSAAHGGGKSMAFNLHSKLGDIYTEAVRRAIDSGDFSELIGWTLQVIIHEGQHILESTAATAHTDTHDLPFKVDVYSRYGALVRRLLERTENGTILLAEKVALLKERYGQSTITGQEFYARLQNEKI